MSFQIERGTAEPAKRSPDFPESCLNFNFWVNCAFNIAFLKESITWQRGACEQNLLQV